MSLITLRSQTGQEPSLISCNFREGIVLGKGNTLELVNVSLVKKDYIVQIEEDVNDTLVWRIGTYQHYSQHVVRVAPGNYTNAQLASAIKSALNDSTLLGPYKGGWDCTFTPQTGAVQGYYTISMTENPTPTTENADTLELDEAISDISPGFSLTEDVPSHYIQAAFERTTDTTVDNVNNIGFGFYGDKSIYGANGYATYVIKPLRNLTNVNLASAEMPNYRNSGSTYPVSFTTPGGLPNGWVYQVDVNTGAFTVYAALLDNGVLAMAETTGFDVNDDTHWFGRYEWKVAGDIFIKAGDPLESQKITGVGGTVLTPTYAAACYPLTRVGFSSNQMIESTKNPIPGGDGGIDKEQDGMSLVFEVKNNSETWSASSSILVSLFCLDSIGSGVPHPLPGWKTLKPIFENAPPAAWSFLSGNPANWTLFSHGSDSIRVKIVVSNIRNIQVYISHDTAGNNYFVEEVKIAASDFAFEGDLNFLEEKDYPLVPSWFMGAGNNIDGSVIRLGGLYDDERIGQEGLELENYDWSFDNEYYSESSVSPFTSMNKEVLFKFGDITNYSFDNNWDPLFNIANIHAVIGMLEVERADAGAAFTVSSDRDVDDFIGVNIFRNNIFIELPDFNIKSYSGESSDTTKSVAVIPGNELKYSQESGIVNYVSPYPIPVDLNLPHDKVFYQLNAWLRLGNGKFLDGLLHPTTLTFRVGRSPESVQEIALTNAMSKVMVLMGERQDSKISNFNSNVPLY